LACPKFGKERRMSSFLRPRIRYAQNFLTDSILVEQLLDRSTIGPDDLVYEIGPGTGIITERLAARCRQVVAVEHDPRLVELLRRRFAGRPNISIIAGDFLAASLPETPYKVFANIPFNRTAAIITKLTRSPLAPEDQYLVVQREAAQRFMGRPATTLTGLLLVPWFQLSIGFRFRRTDFTPPPGVDVVLLRIAKRGPPLVPRAAARLYHDFIITLITARQPCIGATLQRLCGRRCSLQIVKEAGIDLRAKPGGVAVEQWLRLYSAFECYADNPARYRISGAADRLQHRQASLHKLHRTRIRTTGPAPPICMSGIATVPV
jgi:23S rRNA (adenine-N6)-dimethyltransferase